MPKSFSFGLRGNIIVTISVVVFASAMAMTVAFVSKSKELTEEILTNEIRAQAALLSSHMENGIEAINAELSALSQLPQIRAVIEPYRGLEAPSQRAMSAEDVSEQAQQIFSAVLRERPAYTQIRILSADPAGRELVRVHRTEKGIEAVAQGQLQSKGSEAYFEAAMRFFRQGGTAAGSDDAAAREPYLSRVTLNREHGAVTEPRTATLRIIEPIHSSGGAIVGFLIINTDYGKLLEQSFDGIQTDHTVFVFNESLDYFEYNPRTNAARFEFHQERRQPVPRLLIDASSGLGQAEISNASDIAIPVRTVINADPARYFVVLVSADKAALLAKVSELNFEGYLLSLMLGGIALLIASVLSHQLTRPLIALTQSVAEARSGKAELELAMDRTDEVGILAREFQGLYSKLAESELKSRLILNSVGDGIIAISPNGVIVEANPALEWIFGYDQGELIGRNVSVLMPDGIARKHDGFLEHYEDTQDRRIDWAKREETGRRKSGETFPISLTVTTVDLGSETLYIGIVQDVSERKAVENAKGEFLALVSHELRSPLTSVMAAIRILDATLPCEGGSQSKKMLELAQRNSNRLLALVEDLLDFESYSRGVLRFEQSVFPVGELIEYAVEIEAAKAERFGVNVICQRPEQPLYFNGDQKRLLQAISNVLGNAIKFSSEGADVHVKAEEAPGGESVLITIEDEGVGIPDADLDRIFCSFVQSDSSDSRKAEGVGLGLSIVKKIIDYHGGKISVSSEVDVGTRFTIELPLHSVIAQDMQNEPRDRVA